MLAAHTEYNKTEGLLGREKISLPFFPSYFKGTLNANPCADLKALYKGSTDYSSRRGVAEPAAESKSLWQPHWCPAHWTMPILVYSLMLYKSRQWEKLCKSFPWIQRGYSWGPYTSVSPSHLWQWNQTKTLRIWIQSFLLSSSLPAGFSLARQLVAWSCPISSIVLKLSRFMTL